MDDLRDGLALVIFAVTPRFKLAGDDWPAATDWDKETAYTKADAAIAHLWPIFKEQAAKVADGMVSADTDWDNSYRNQCAEVIAARLRIMEQPK